LVSLLIFSNIGGAVTMVGDAPNIVYVRTLLLINRPKHRPRI
jgi:Na+/H+ antiporter NhaD/arsenite permease-like protein